MISSTVQKILITLSVCAFLLFGASAPTLSQSTTTSSTTLTLSKVGELDVMPHMIFLETSLSKPEFVGNAKPNATVTVEINGEKNETKAGADGKWTWAPETDLKGEVDLKISSGTESLLYRVIVKSASEEAPVSTEATPPAAPVVEDNIFEDSEEPADEVVTAATETPANPLTAYLPFILGGLGVGILLLIISRILRPKQTVLSEVPPVSTPPMSNTPVVESPSTSWTPPTPVSPVSTPTSTPSEPVVPPPPPMPDFSAEPVQPTTPSPDLNPAPQTPLAGPSEPTAPGSTLASDTSDQPK